MVIAPHNTLGSAPWATPYLGDGCAWNAPARRLLILALSPQLSEDERTEAVKVNHRGGERPQYVRENAERANTGAKAFVRIYEDFVRLARKNLTRRLLPSVRAAFQTGCLFGKQYRKQRKWET